MMIRRRIDAISTFALLVSMASTMLTTSASTPSSKPAFAKPFAPIAGYTTWRKVTPHPIAVADALSILCRLPTEQEINTVGSGPHYSTYIQVYVNKTGEGAMYSKEPIKFPEGSVIVKERHDGPTGPLQLMTVMVKGAKGSQPKTGDWQFYVTNAGSSLISRTGRLAHCETCHTKTKSTDYVYRTYLF